MSERSEQSERSERREISVWTDGACSANGRSGARAGYGIFFGDNDPRNVSARLPGETQTNQRGELYAILEACRIVFANSEHDTCKLTICTDSLYSIRCVKEWFPNWKKNGFVTANKKPVLNLDLIKPIREFFETKNIEFIHVRGHQKITSASPLNAINNDKADKLATASLSIGRLSLIK